MSFTIATNPQALFGARGEYYIEALLDYKVYSEERKVKVTVKGVRGYSKYSWNFKTYITCTLGLGNSSVTQTFTLPSSGSNSYKGYLPKNGSFNDGLYFSKTFYYNDDGELNDAYITLTGENPNVYWISQGVTTSAYTTTGTESISNYLPKLDVTPATVSLQEIKPTIKTIGFKALASATVSSWQVTVSTLGYSKTYVYEEIGTSLSKYISVPYDAEYEISVITTRKSNSSQSIPQTITTDCRIPSCSCQITEYEKDVTSDSIVNVKFNLTNYAFSSLTPQCEYQILDNVKNIVKDWENLVGTEINSSFQEGITNSIYFLRIRRKDNEQLFYDAAFQIDTRVPRIIRNNYKQDYNQLQLFLTSGNNYTFDWKVKDPNNLIYTNNNSKNYVWTSSFISLGNITSNEVPYSIEVTLTNPVNKLKDEKIYTFYLAEMPSYIYDKTGTWQPCTIYLHVLDQDKKVQAQLVKTYVFMEDDLEWHFVQVISST